MLHEYFYFSLQTIEGQVFDRHLLGLRLLAKENNIEMPAVFTDPSYAKSVHFCLSTSQVWHDRFVFIVFNNYLSLLFWRNDCYRTTTVMVPCSYALWSLSSCTLYSFLTFNELKTIGNCSGLYLMEVIQARVFLWMRVN